jgi:hypothetical protein
MGAIGGGGGAVGKLHYPIDKVDLRDWWHNILRDHGKFPCIAIILVLPSDNEALRYFSDFGKELDQISGKNCLVAALGSRRLKRQFSDFDDDLWGELVEKHVSEGNSIQIAKYFNIGFDEFPCVVLFKDIRSSEHIIIALRDMTTREISNRMRSLFSAIDEAVKDNNDILDALEKQRSKENIKKSGKAAISHLQSFGGKTLESIIEILLKAAVQ